VAHRRLPFSLHAGLVDALGAATPLSTSINPHLALLTASKSKTAARSGAEWFAVLSS
jgi:hypothetical protein